MTQYFALSLYGAPVAQSVSAPYLYSSIRPKLCGGCEFEPHLEHFLFCPFLFRRASLMHNH